MHEAHVYIIGQSRSLWSMGDGQLLVLLVAGSTMLLITAFLMTAIYIAFGMSSSFAPHGVHTLMFGSNKGPSSSTARDAEAGNNFPAAPPPYTERGTEAPADGASCRPRECSSSLFMQRQLEPAAGGSVSADADAKEAEVAV